MRRRLDLSDYDPEPTTRACRWCSRGWHHECRGCNCRHDHDEEEQDMNEPIRPAAEIIDEIRADYTAKRIHRVEAIDRIRATVSVTEYGAADLLDHEDSAVSRYATGTES